jgi:hypothetical protein
MTSGAGRRSSLTLPVPIEEIVEFGFELEVVPIDGILDDLEVDAFLTSDLKRVYVDAFVLQHRRRRYRFSLAHELAHHELHRRLYEESRVASVRDWRAVQDAIAVQTARRAGLTDATLWSEAGKEHVARWLATQFEVSEQVIERRLEKDGLWPAPPVPVP